jgi:hypothetical protein
MLKNEHVMMQQRACRSGDTVEMDKGEIGADQFAFFTIGVTNPNEEAGKTGRIELALPKSLVRCSEQLHASQESSLRSS